MCNSAVALTGRSGNVTVSPRQRGFSLLELLVALMVIVLVTTLVNFTVSSGGQDVQVAAVVSNLADVARYALDEAEMTGVDYGLLLEEEPEGGQTRYSYRWLERHIDGWGEPASGKEVFAKQHLPPGIALELELEDAPEVEFSLDDDEQDDNNQKEDAINPQVVLYASGETTVGAINVRRVDDGELLWRIQWDLLGRFDVLLRGEVGEEEDE
jgi:general secretion pathway protein H